MNTESTQAYGLWWLVIINSLVFVIFAFSFAKPQSARDWRSFGAFSLHRGAVRMYGFPLPSTLSRWQPLSQHRLHDPRPDRLLERYSEWRANPHSTIPFASFVFIDGEFILLASA